MSAEYKKECYDSNPNIKVHFSYGMRGVGASLPFLHYDKDLIIEYYKKGEASIRIEGNLYDINQGDIIILNPDEMHISERKESCYMEKIVLHVNNGLLMLFGGERTVFFETISKKQKGKGNLIPAKIVKKLRISEIIEQCLGFAKQNSLESEVLLACKTVELLSILATFIKNDDGVNREPDSSNKTVNTIMNYINRHYVEDLTLDMLADRFHFSKYYISHLFKDYVGISPYDYLIVRRLYGCNNLIRSGYTVKEASLEVGFSNYSNFYRLYKKYFKITPQEFKEQMKQEDIVR